METERKREINKNSSGKFYKLLNQESKNEFYF
jgi:hypothetical protein